MDEDHHSSRSTLLVFLLLVLASLLFLSARLSERIQALKDIMQYIIAPGPHTALRAVRSSQRVAGTLAEMVAVHRENEHLREALRRMTLNAARGAAAARENDDLRRQLGFSARRDIRSLTAAVTIREPAGWYQWFIIDRGFADGITLDAPVLAWSGDMPVAVGRIAVVHERDARVVLITSQLSSIPVAVASTDEDGLLQGTNEDRAVLTFLPADSAVKVGDLVVASPLSSVFPPGITVGTVEDVSHSPRENAIGVRPAINLSRIRFVTVIVSVPGRITNRSLLDAAGSGPSSRRQGARP